MSPAKDRLKGRSLPCSVCGHSVPQADKGKPKEAHTGLCARVASALQRLETGLDELRGIDRWGGKTLKPVELTPWARDQLHSKLIGLAAVAPTPRGPDGRFITLKAEHRLTRETSKGLGVATASPSPGTSDAPGAPEGPESSVGGPLNQSAGTADSERSDGSASTLQDNR